MSNYDAHLKVFAERLAELAGVLSRLSSDLARMSTGSELNVPERAMSSPSEFTGSATGEPIRRMTVQAVRLHSTSGSDQDADQVTGEFGKREPTS